MTYLPILFIVEPRKPLREFLSNLVRLGWPRPVLLGDAAGLDDLEAVPPGSLLLFSTWNSEASPDTMGRRIEGRFDRGRVVILLSPGESAPGHPLEILEPARFLETPVSLREIDRILREILREEVS